MGAQLSPGGGKITVATLQQLKRQHQPIVVLTGYDYPTAQALEQAGVDAILVGDSLGMVVLGYPDTLSVTMDDMLHHCKAVARGAPSRHLIGDMPFLSYQVSPAEAVRNAGRFLQEARMDAVKLEGGREVVPAVEAIVAAGIPVMGHLGLTPQSVRKLGGFKMQAKSPEAARRLVEDAIALEHAGCYAVVLEAIPDAVAELVTERLEIPTIGIGAGRGCDGQVLVAHDVLGLFQGFTPTFVRRYADLGAEMARAFGAYVADVRARRFPGSEHGYALRTEDRDALIDAARLAAGGD